MQLAWTALAREWPRKANLELTEQKPSGGLGSPALITRKEPTKSDSWRSYLKPAKISCTHQLKYWVILNSMRMPINSQSKKVLFSVSLSPVANRNFAFKLALNWGLWLVKICVSPLLIYLYNIVLNYRKQNYCLQLFTDRIFTRQLIINLWGYLPVPIFLSSPKWIMKCSFFPMQCMPYLFYCCSVYIKCTPFKELLCCHWK